MKNKLPTILFFSLIAVAFCGVGSLQAEVLTDVPFLSQAPLGQWGDWRQQQGCEEASALMAVHWAYGDTSIDPTYGRNRIVQMSDWEKKEFGNYVDTSIPDTAYRLLDRFLGFKGYEVKTNITVKDIAYHSVQGKLLIVPIDGRKIGNPHYKNGGPRHHEILITGYERDTDLFVFNDPGTRYGQGMKIKGQVLQAALRDYPSGNGNATNALPPGMIIINK